MIRILDKNFTFLGEIDDFENFVFTRRLFSFGEFEMSINSDKRNLLSQGNIIFLDSNRSGIIGFVEEKISPKGNNLLVKGYTPEFLLSYRITEPLSTQASWSMTNKSETVIKSLVDYNLGQNANNSDRVIPYFVVKPSLNRGKSVTFETCYKKLNEDIAFLAEESGLGISVSLNLAELLFEFDVIVGRNLTANQNLNPAVIFSMDFNNVFEQTYVCSDLDFKNVAVVAGSGEGSARTIVYVNDQLTGDQRREIFVEAKSIPNNESSKLSQAGLAKLADYPEIYSLDGLINPFHSLKYGRDFLLGDLVTMKFKNISLNTQITEVTESWDSKNGYTLECTFGNKVPDLISIIKKNLKG